MLRRLITLIAVIAIAVTPSLTAAQTANQDEFRAAFDQLLRQQSRNWWTVTYDPWSVGYPVVWESSSDGRSAVFAAGFRYTTGSEDVIYVAVSNGTRTCLAYRSESGSCSLTGRSSSGSGITGGDLLIGGIILCAIFCSGSGGTQPSRQSDGYDQYEQDCIARGLRPGNC